MISRKVLTCRLCKNHGVLTPLRGHKSNCPHQRCNCLSCKTTQMRKAEANRSRAKGKRTYNYQSDELNSEVLKQFENRTSDREFDENQTVVAWINGEEIQDKSVGAHVSEQVQRKDESLCAVKSKDEPLCAVKSEDEPLCASPFQQTVKATAVARTQILKQIKELHDLKECGALSTKEFEDAKAVVLKDFK